MKNKDPFLLLLLESQSLLWQGRYPAAGGNPIFGQVVMPTPTDDLVLQDMANQPQDPPPQAKEQSAETGRLSTSSERCSFLRELLCQPEQSTRGAEYGSWRSQLRIWGGKCTQSMRRLQGFEIIFA